MGVKIPLIRDTPDQYYACTYYLTEIAQVFFRKIEKQFFHFWVE